MGDMECENCGGADFYKEAGFFYCSGCQVQSQEVREYVYEEFGAGDAPQAKKPSRKIQSDKNDQKFITSWECYNYILLGLTHELINLGAQKEIKAVVRVLWLRYLEKLHVIKLGEDRMPELQTVSSRLDGQIVYGKLARIKRKRRTSSSSETVSHDSASIKRERIKRRRALAKAQYEEFSQKSLDSHSVHTDTLTSLPTGSEKSSKQSIPVRYNVYAAREIKKVTGSLYHWRRHRRDHGLDLKCHRLNYRQISHKHRISPHIISLNKIYSILYLALLIVKDKIQLNDLLRFMIEGNLSYNTYSHFFPEDYADKTLNFRNFKKHSLFANAPFRVMTSEMSVFLGIESHIPSPDLVSLAQRFCIELNLPTELSHCVNVILSKTRMSMSYRKRFNKVPNYEGRILSIIIFLLKLLFALDDSTEFHLGDFADILNSSQFVSPKMFNVVQWLHFLQYRHWIMSKRHFPTNFMASSEPKNVDLVVGALLKKIYPTETKINREKDDYRQLLAKLSFSRGEAAELPASLTPLRDGLKSIVRQSDLGILSKDFRGNSLACFLQPEPFLQLFDHSPEVVHGGASEEIVVDKVTCVGEESRRENAENMKLVTVKLSFEKVPSRNEAESCSNTKSFEAVRTSPLKTFTNVSSINLDFDRIRKDISGQEYPRHYNCCEKFWLRNKLRLEALSQDDCHKFFKDFPQDFRVVFKECQRIAQQSEQELLVEYQFTELYLVYLASFGKKKLPKVALRDRLIANYLKKNAHLW